MRSCGGVSADQQILSATFQPRDQLGSDAHRSGKGAIFAEPNGPQISARIMSNR